MQITSDWLPKFARRKPPISAPPPIAVVDGVPADLKYAFSSKTSDDVSGFHHKCYGIFTRGGKKHYFQVKRDEFKLEYVKRGIEKTQIFPFTVKVCPQDTTFRVLFKDTEPTNIKQWQEEIFNTYDLQTLHVFFIKKPRDYFKSFKWNQNLWPIDLTPANPRPETNPYFIE